VKNEEAVFVSVSLAHRVGIKLPNVIWAEFCKVTCSYVPEFDDPIALNGVNDPNVVPPRDDLSVYDADGWRTQPHVEVQTLFEALLVHAAAQREGDIREKASHGRI